MALTYKKSGVDISKADKLIASIKTIAKTIIQLYWVLLGGFSGFFKLDFKKY